MNTVDIRQIMIIAVLAALFILLVVLVVLAANAIKSLKNTNKILEDAKTISAIAAAKTTKVDGVVDEATDMVLNLADTIRGNSSLIGIVSNIGTGLVAAKGVASKLRTSDEEEYLRRARARKASKAGKAKK